MILEITAIGANDFEGILSVRRVRPNPRSLTGDHTSIKTGKVVEFESSLELDFIFLLDVDPRVVWFDSQPVEIEYRDRNGKASHYTPDFLVHFRAYGDEEERWGLYEVEFLEDLCAKWDEYKPKFSAAGAYAEERQFPFEVHTQYEIRTPRLENAKMLWDYCRRSRIPGDHAAIMGILEETRGTTIQQFTSLLYTRFEDERISELITALWQLIADQLIRCDLERVLTPATRIWHEW